MTRKLLTDEHAARYTPGTPYRPSSGTEGDCFAATWCNDCKHCGEIEEMYGALGCTLEIDLNAMDHEIDEPGYPPEWVHGPDGQPMCTAHQADSGERREGGQ